eukprot:TRINITY_DN7713_c0_g1_i1.p4 TRINITY_DN7713_c0_g1~~TRINITY_DN7713_c0_g1_i1.p4  ORF type:complete len:52 (-),score=16.52 TRINITY_DN7713_c0_g1_i1:2-157(-)
MGGSLSFWHPLWFHFVWFHLFLDLLYLSLDLPNVLCVDTGRSSETAKAHRG